MIDSLFGVFALIGWCAIVLGMLLFFFSRYEKKEIEKEHEFKMLQQQEFEKALEISRNKFFSVLNEMRNTLNRDNITILSDIRNQYKSVEVQQSLLFLLFYYDTENGISYFLINSDINGHRRLYKETLNGFQLVAEQDGFITKDDLDYDLFMEAFQSVAKVPHQPFANSPNCLAFNNMDTFFSSPELQQEIITYNKHKEYALYSVFSDDFFV